MRGVLLYSNLVCSRNFPHRSGSVRSTTNTRQLVGMEYSSLYLPTLSFDWEKIFTEKDGFQKDLRHNITNECPERVASKVCNGCTCTVV